MKHWKQKDGQIERVVGASSSRCSKVPNLISTAARTQHELPRASANRLGNYLEPGWIVVDGGRWLSCLHTYVGRCLFCILAAHRGRGPGNGRLLHAEDRAAQSCEVEGSLRTGVWGRGGGPCPAWMARGNSMARSFYCGVCCVRSIVLVYTE